MKTKYFIAATAFYLFTFAGPSIYSQYELKPPSGVSIDTNGFLDSSHHWYHIADEEYVISALPDQQRYKNTDIAKIADNILLYQKTNGGWPKNYDMLAILIEEQRQAVHAAENDLHTTFDNGTTHSQVDHLAKAYSIVKDEKYKAACLRGIDFILSAQYDNGGWPQFYPDTSDYRKYITFNDGAMIGVMTVLRNIFQGKPYYSFVDNIRRERVRKAFAKGLECILKCQIVNNGRPTAWGQQHDNVDLRPRIARTYELPSVSGGESAEIVRFLMSVDSPSERIIASIRNAIRWFDQKKIYGIRVQVIEAPVAHFKYHTVNFDRSIVRDSSAQPIWARMYELGTERPLFSGRDGKSIYSLAEVERERRTGYSWYTYAPDEVLRKYPAWRKRWSVDVDVLKK
jgi:PelA/Pel-15E family pectate lyase